MCDTSEIYVSVFDAYHFPLLPLPPPPLTVVNSVQYECTYIITEDYPPGDKEVVFKAGDRIVQVRHTVCLLPW